MSKPTILLLGATGSGKSTFVEKCDPKSWSRVMGDTKISSHQVHSCTEVSTLYKFNNINLIDTPGIFDSKSRSQQLFDNLFDNCYNYKEFNHFVVFHKYAGKFDENFREMLKIFEIFLGGPPDPRWLTVCFTGTISAEQKAEIRMEFCLSFRFNYTFWDLADDSERLSLLTELESTQHQVYTTDRMSKIKTRETKISELESQLKVLLLESKVNESKIHRLQDAIQEQRNARLKALISQNSQCIGMTKNGSRCRNTINCYYLRSLLQGYNPHDEYFVSPNQISLSAEEILDQLTALPDEKNNSPDIEFKPPSADATFLVVDLSTRS